MDRLQGDNSETGEINSGKLNSTYIPHRFDTTGQIKRVKRGPGDRVIGSLKYLIRNPKD